MNDASGHTEIERFHPVVLYSLLDALRRFEPDFYSHICRSYKLDADRIIGLFTEVEEVGSALLLNVLMDMRKHQAYHNIVHLAGRNAFLQWAELKRIRRPLFGNQSARFNSLLKQHFPEFLGKATSSLMVRGDILFLDITHSIFARGVKYGRPTCGFYGGLLTEMSLFCGATKPQITESRCAAMESSLNTCLFQVVAE
jgi:hypothetical protein